MWFLLACGAHIEADTAANADADTDADSDADVDTATEGDSDADTDTDTDTDADSDLPAPWRHAATVDGSAAEYGHDETFATSSGGTAYLTWDDTTLYVAMAHPDVLAGGPEHWALVYLGDGTGTTVGESFHTQQPALPTPMSALIRRKADGSYDSLETWNGGGWDSAPGWLGTDGSAVAEGTTEPVLELAIPFAAFGDPAVFDLHLAWVYEGDGSESTYAPIPAGSFTDGYDPDFTRWYRFDRASATPPASVDALP
jgi:hypothetical protein